MASPASVSMVTDLRSESLLAHNLKCNNQCEIFTRGFDLKGCRTRIPPVMLGYTFRRRRGTALTHPNYNRLTAAAGRTISEQGKEQ
jgi:hypothetical protein